MTSPPTLPATARREAKAFPFLGPRPSDRGGAPCSDLSLSRFPALTPYRPVELPEVEGQRGGFAVEAVWREPEVVVVAVAERAEAGIASVTAQEEVVSVAPVGDRQPEPAALHGGR